MTQLAMFDSPPPTPHLRPAEPIVRTAVIDGCYRYELRRAWGPGPSVAFAMLNPSEADGERDDPTLWRIMGFAFRWGFGSLAVGNVYPFRSPSPRSLDIWRLTFASDQSARDAFQRNAHVCREMFSRCALRVAAWGNGTDQVELRAWLAVVEATADPIDWHCLGTTQSRAPKHPLARGKHRIPDDQKPIKWRA